MLSINPALSADNKLISWCYAIVKVVQTNSYCYKHQFILVTWQVTIKIWVPYDILYVICFDISWETVDIQNRNALGVRMSL